VSLDSSDVEGLLSPKNVCHGIVNHTSLPCTGTCLKRRWMPQVYQPTHY